MPAAYARGVRVWRMSTARVRASGMFAHAKEMLDGESNSHVDVGPLAEAAEEEGSNGRREEGTCGTCQGPALVRRAISCHACDVNSLW
jgi:hypothetical protein